jgi:alpha-1,2-mannosyltransferase
MGIAETWSPNAERVESLSSAQRKSGAMNCSDDEIVFRRAQIGLTWLGICCVAALAQVALWWVSEPAYLFSDFYKAYYPVGQVLLAEGPRQTWDAGESGVLTFVNLPILGYLFVPLAVLDPLQAAWIYLGFGVVAIAAMLLLLARCLDLSPRKFAILVLLFAVNGPLVNSLREGNTSHIVALLLTVSLVLILSGWLFTAGALLGFCALVKLPLLLFGVYYLVQRRWRIVAGSASAIGLLVLLSVGIFGAQVNLGWYQNCVAPYLKGVVGAFNVQSIDAFLLRLATGEAQLWDWDPIEISLFHRIVRTLIVGSMFAATLFPMLRANRRGPRVVAQDANAQALVEFVLVLNLALVTSPLSWTHYYLLLLLPAALLLAGRLPTADGPATYRLMYVGLLLASLPVMAPGLGDRSLGPVFARTAVSVWLLGGLLMLAGLTRAAWQQGLDPPPVRQRRG